MGQNLEQTQRLLDIMTQLRDPNGGCPWDVEQTHQSLRKYVIEEAYEVAEAIDLGDDKELVKELGDLLLQIVFHAEIARLENRFEFEDIAHSISDKMVQRHPHVFGDAPDRNAAEQKQDWERIKAEERGARGTLDGVSLALPALMRAEKLQKRAARVGFDWRDGDEIRGKINEEIDELANATPDEKAEEFGDVLFSLVNYGRHLGIDPEEALTKTNEKFTRRFTYIESQLAKNGDTPQNASLDAMEALWQDAKSKAP